MANNIKGITIEIGGDTSPLDKALKEVNKTSRDLQSELKEVNRQLKLDPTNTVLLEQKQKLLAESLNNTKSKLETLKEAEKQVQQQFVQGKVSEEQYRALQREVIKTEQSLEGLEGEARKANAVLSKDEAVDNIKNIGKAAAGAALGAGLAIAGMTASVLNNADELQRQADVTGISAERLQELQYVGNNLGVSLDTITGAQAKLTKSMDAAKGGTGAQAEAFKALGISVVDSKGHLKNAQDVMNEAFTALGKVGNETERDALSMSIFGKSAMEMNPLIKAGSDGINKLSEEAKKNGAVMSNEAVAGLDSLGDTMDSIKNSIMGAFGEKLSSLLPTIQMLIDKLMNLPQWVHQNSTLLEVLGVIIGTIAVLIIAFNIQQALLASGMTLWGAIAAGTTTVTTGLGVAFAFLTSPIGLVILAIGALIVAGVLLYKHWDTVKSYTLSAWNAIKDFFINLGSWLVSLFTTWGPLILTILFPFLGIPLQIIKHWDGIKAFFINMKDSIKDALHDMFNFQIPHIKLPHFNITGGFSLNPPSIPHLNVDWFDKGGTFYGPQVIGIAEKRPEFVGALDDLRKIVGDEIDKRSQSQIIFQGTYSFRDNTDIDYFMSEAAKLVNRRK